MDLSALGGRDEIRVRAGDPLKMDVPISGAPTPTVSWLSYDNKLDSSPQVCSSFTQLSHHRHLVTLCVCVCVQVNFLSVGEICEDF